MPNRNLTRLVSLIKANEGVRNKVYKDTKGIDTIGVGFTGAMNNDTVQNALEKGYMSDDQINQVLMEEIQNRAAKMEKFFPGFNKLPYNTQDAFMDAAFNRSTYAINKEDRNGEYMDPGALKEAVRRYAPNNPIAMKTIAEWMNNYSEARKAKNDELGIHNRYNDNTQRVNMDYDQAIKEFNDNVIPGEEAMKAMYDKTHEINLAPEDVLGLASPSLRYRCGGRKC